MGVIKGGLLTLCVVFLFLSLLAMNSFLTVSMSLSYDSLYSEMHGVVKELAEKEMDLSTIVEENRQEFQEHCLSNSEYNLEQGDFKVVLPCSMVSASSEEIIEYSIDDLIKQNYYKEYDCGLWDCMKQQNYPFVLVSEKAKNYWQGKFYLALGLVILFGVGCFFFVENRNSFPIVVGSVFGIASLPFAKLSWFVSLLAPANEMIQFFTVFFSKSYVVFLISLIFGIVLVGVGVVLKVMKVGQYVSEKVEQVKGVFDKKVERKVEGEK